MGRVNFRVGDSPTLPHSQMVESDVWFPSSRAPIRPRWWTAERQVSGEASAIATVASGPCFPEKDAEVEIGVSGDTKDSAAQDRRYLARNSINGAGHEDIGYIGKWSCDINQHGDVARNLGHFCA